MNPVGPGSSVLAPRKIVNILLAVYGTEDHTHPWEKNLTIPVKVYGERSGDIVSAIRALRRGGMYVGLPHQTADGVMILSIGRLHPHGDTDSRIAR
jgi:hypothetical protein